MKKLLFGVLLVTSFVFGVVFSRTSEQYPFKNIESDEVVSVNREKVKSVEDYPVLDLPVRYFDYKYLNSHSVCDEKESNVTECHKGVKSGNFGGVYAYQSYPSTDISIDGYDNYDSKKPPSVNEILAEVSLLRSKDGDVSAWSVASDELIRKYFKEFGPVAGHFLPRNSDASVSMADLTMDGRDEHIVFTCPHGAAGSGCGALWVADSSGNLLFSYSDPAIELDPSEDGNGFYLYSVHPEDTEASCCERKRYRTRFVYEDKRFVPIFEQVVVDLKVEPRQK